MNAAHDINIESGEFNLMWHLPNELLRSGWGIVSADAPDDGESHLQVAGSPDDHAMMQTDLSLEELAASGANYCANYRTPFNDAVSDWGHTLREYYGFRDNAHVVIPHPMADDGSEAEEYSGQIEMLPNQGEVSIVVSKLALDDLREFAASVMNVAVNAACRRGSDLETVRLLNSWFATMEETVAAGDDLEEILSRRI